MKYRSRDQKQEQNQRTQKKNQESKTYTKEIPSMKNRKQEIRRKLPSFIQKQIRVCYGKTGKLGLITASNDQTQLLDATSKHHPMGDENVDHSRKNCCCTLQMAPSRIPRT